MTPTADCGAPFDGVRSAHRWRSNGELLAAVASIGYLRLDADIVLDPTYGRGLWWTHVRPARLITHDIALDGVDFRSLPESSASVDVVAFDPPYVCGRRTLDNGVNERFRTRYSGGAPGNRHDLVDLVEGGVSESARVTRRGGIVLLKCQPFQNGKRDFVHMPSVVIAAAREHGLRLEDELIHVRPSGPAKTATFNGVRSAHSVLLVFSKRAAIRKRATLSPNDGSRS